ncbi:MAG: alpha/beta hydrolase [Deltaproteobacteria bacterium]|nr:alpha/beta hydrolase [Deltaproteobacteria bacterium]
MSQKALQSVKNSTNVRSEKLIQWSIKMGFGITQQVAPTLAARLAARLFCTTRRFRRPQREKRWMRDALPLETRVNGQRIAVWTWGTGPAVLFVHGWEGRGSQLGAYVEPLVKAGFRVVAFDGPGHGGSDGRTSSIPQMARAMVRVGQMFGPFQGVISHSFGTAATTYALELGLNAKRLVYIAPPADFDIYLNMLAELVGMSDTTRERMLGLFETQLGIRWSELRRFNLDLARDLPLLVVHDSDDLEIPAELGRQVADAWPNSRFLATSGLGHRRILRTDHVVDAVIAFVNETTEARRAS